MKQDVRMMGTTISLTIHHENAQALLTESFNKLKEYELIFSANDDRSDLMKLNRNAGIQSVKVHPHLFELISIGKHFSCQPSSKLNIAIGPLVKAWGIGFPNARRPENEEIVDLLLLTDPEKIILNEETHHVYLTDKKMEIDLGCLAKGYIADLLKTYLMREDVSSALINLGGNIVTIGQNIKSGKLWRIGLQVPFKERKNHEMILPLEDSSIVTSGVYERELNLEGKHYHHILDPKTGYPVETSVQSISIISDRSVIGEAYTSMLFGEDIETALNMMDNTFGIEGIIISETNVFKSRGIK